MAFSFNFPDPSLSDNPLDGKSFNTCSNNEEEDLSQVVEPFQEWFPNEKSLDPDIARSVYTFSKYGSISCLDSAAVEKRLTAVTGTACGVKEAAEQHSDLIPYVYEGGLKVWECAIDLTEYLCGVDMTDKMVLELGCGAGIPGILAMLQRATKVHFQDYNPEVIENYTIPNVTLNVPTEFRCTCRYFSGDWDKFRENMAKQNIRYDYIVTAETIYKPENYRKLSRIFQDFLLNTGTIFVAAKSNYFGVGGGTREFEQFIQHEGKFNIDICRVIETGVPREILKLTWKQHKQT